MRFAQVRSCIGVEMGREWGRGKGWISKLFLYIN
jgi:hypothetical protein